MHVGMRMPPMAKEIGVESTIAWAGESGFGSVDLPEATPDLSRACRVAGVGIGTVDWGVGGDLLSKDTAKRRKAATAMKKRIRDTAKHGNNVVFLCLSPDDRTQNRADTFDILKKVYPGILAQAEKSGVHLAIEPYPGPAPDYPFLGCTPETLRGVFEAVPSPNFGICYDPSHFVRIGVDYKRLLMEFGDRVKHVHAKDTEILEDGVYEFGRLGQSFGQRYSYGEGWWRYCIPGWGDVDWHWVVARLEELGYEGPLAIELEDHRYSGSPELNKEGLLAAKGYLETVLRPQ
ncbi:TPA: sugar phosphate isomerase/epimerase [Candidatus Latescibacteria bacterium]|nr:sugar phosphate isomerase/epimerase [Candidatus Latescibacterota bacterium]